MENILLSEIAEAVEGVLINGSNNISINGVSTDTRKINSGNLFVALVGSNFDGNNFVPRAFELGASAALVSKVSPGENPQILVKDTGEALKSFAKYYGTKFNVPIVAVTGSTGKTSTKEMIYSVLSQKLIVHKTQQNFNNEIGLPLTMFDLENKHDISVLEMGMNNFHEIQRLVEISKPDVGVITNIGTAHIENLGTREGIFKAKMEITTYFKEGNVLVVNGDDDYLGTLKSNSYKVVKVSIKGNGDYNAFDLVNQGEEGIEFKCICKGNIEVFKLTVPGVHNVYNALMAIAVGEIYGLSIEEIKKGIFNFAPGKLRMEILNYEDIKIINDCYNANEDSMKAALDVLSNYKSGKRIAIVGDMFELGNYSEEAHRQVGKYLRGKCDIFIAVGAESRYIYDEAIKHTRGFHYNSREEACINLNSLIQSGDVILIKASRGMKMEEITKFLTQDRKRGF